jgi:hypothetical protein
MDTPYWSDTLHGLVKTELVEDASTARSKISFPATFVPSIMKTDWEFQYGTESE